MYLHVMHVSTNTKCTTENMYPITYIHLGKEIITHKRKFDQLYALLLPAVHAL